MLCTMSAYKQGCVCRNDVLQCIFHFGDSQINEEKNDNTLSFNSSVQHKDPLVIKNKQTKRIRHIIKPQLQYMIKLGAAFFPPQSSSIPS